MSPGGALGGSQWGSAADRDKMYVAVSDLQITGVVPDTTSTQGYRLLVDPKKGGGLFALSLATGEWVTVRTLALVFDPDAATDVVVSEGYRPPVWATSLYTPAPDNALLDVLCTYDDPEEAVREHRAALSMIAVGTNEAGAEPAWVEGLSWAGPGR